jgi:hypothetical protein
MMQIPVLTSGRLLLRPFSHPEVMRFLANTGR